MAEFMHVSVASPIRSGFRAVLAAPGVMLAEVVWRFAFGGVAWVLLVVATVEFLDSIVVSDGDLLLLRSMAPPLAFAALRHMLEGSTARLLTLALVLGPSLALFWIVASAVGRGATLGRLLDREFNQESCWRALLRLSFLRAAVALAALVGVVGSVLLAAVIVGQPERHPAALALIAIGLLKLDILCWAVLNWVLSVAPIFTLRDSREALGSIADAIIMLRRQFGTVIFTSSVFGLMRLVACMGAFALSVIVLVLARQSFLAANLALFAIAVGYFAVDDFLYALRMAAYVAIAEQGPGPVVPEPAPLPFPEGPAPQPAAL
jgi:hypothetical protein